MKLAKYLLFFSFIISCKSEKKKTDDIINANRMLSIVENGSFQNYINLIDDAGYKLIDSTFNYQIAAQMADKGVNIFYKAEDTTGSENSFTCAVGKDFGVNFLRFFTPDKKLFNKINKQIIEEGFKSYNKEVDIDGSTIGYKKKNNPVEVIVMISKESYNIFIGNEERYNLDRIRDSFQR